MTEALRVSLACRRCGHAQTIHCHHAALHPEPERVSPTWDGIVLSSIVRCGQCAAEDEYDLAPATLTALRAAARPTRPSPRGVPEGMVAVAVARLWDGSTMMRPTDGLSHLREIAARQPNSGEAWRRLGNLCEVYDRLDQAEEAWRRAVSVDPDEAEAAMSLASRLWITARIDESVVFLHHFMERFPRAKLTLSMRAQMAGGFVKVLRDLSEIALDRAALMIAWTFGDTPRGEPILNVSSVDIQKIAGWDRLEELLSSGTVTGLAITRELPANEPTILQQTLSGEHPLPGEVEVAHPAFAAWTRRPVKRLQWVSPSKKANKRRRG